MTIKSSTKVAQKYVCEKCDYITSRKYNFEKHLQTKKHNANKMLNNANKMLISLPHICDCGKKYKHISSFSRHKNNCEIHKKTNDKIIEKNVQIEEIIEKHSDKNIVINVNNNNNYYDNKVTHNNSNNTNNNTNNTYSVKNYLNNECKDAYTVKDVIDNFNCDIMKLPAETFPFYKDIVDKAFKNIPLEKLPIRCSDMKRKKFYGNTDKWQKDFDIVKEFIRKLVDAICEFRKIFSNKNPDWLDNDITSDIMSSIIMNIAKVYDTQTVNKIIKYISERTQIIK